MCYTYINKSALASKCANSLGNNNKLRQVCRLVIPYNIMMNSKMSRPIKSKKNSSLLKAEDQTLKAETSKIQNKLQSLKAEIAMRKTMKNKDKQTEKPFLKATHKNNTAESWTQLSRTANSKPNPQTTDKNTKGLLGLLKKTENDQISQDQIKLHNLFKELNMEQFKEGIMENHGINGLQKLLQLQEEDIDTWRNIPIGFRIKLKKFIKQHQSRKNENNPNQNDGAGEEIQAIIKRRKTQKLYEPIRDKEIEEEENEEIEEIQLDEQGNTSRQLNQENQQDILISSLNSAFLQRRGIIKKVGSSSSINSTHSKNKVRWDSKVVEYNKETSNFETEKFMTKHPKASNKQQERGSLQGDGRGGYCWQCLRKITKVKEEEFEQYEEGVHRTFCNNKCRAKYQKLTHPQIDQTEANEESNGKKEPDSEVDELDLTLF